MTEAPLPIVHGGAPRLEELLRFVEYSAKPRPLPRFLDEVPASLASLMRADVCSIYLREGDGRTLVLRGNVGFPARSVGRVRLQVGEGITGKVVEIGRPISVPRARSHESYREFQELGEGRYPVFLAAPIRGRAGPVGALVVQRTDEGGSWTSADVERLTLLGAMVYAAIRTDELMDQGRDRSRRAGGGTRKLTLTGQPAVAGQALGAIAALRRPAARPSQTNLAEVSVSISAADLDRAAAEIEQAVHGLVRKGEALDMADELQFLQTYLQILQDSRVRERTIELVGTGHSLSAALLQVAREVTKHAARAGGVLEERARDVEDLVDCLVMLTEGDKRAALPQKSILIGDELTVFDLIVSVRTSPVGVVLSERASANPRAAVLAKLLGLPTVLEVEGLFKWISDGDLCLVDGDHGLVFLNPSRATVANFRRSRSKTE